MGGLGQSFDSPETVLCNNNPETCDFRITQKRMDSLMGKMNKEAIERSEKRGVEEEEDLRKIELCSFCRTSHSPEEACQGFGT